MWVHRRLARVVIGLLLSLAVHASCVMPPPLEEITPPTNRPPRSLPQSLAPAPTILPPTEAAACPDRLTFQASLSDPDGDIIYWRVFVDYYADLDREPEVEELVVEDDQPTPIQFTVDSGSFSETNPHTVELYVADRPFAQGQLFAQGRVLTDTEGLVDTFLWTLELDESLNVLCPE